MESSKIRSAERRNRQRIGVRPKATTGRINRNQSGRTSAVDEAARPGVMSSRTLSGSNMRSLTLLVPVFNESSLLEEFLAKTARDLNEGGLDWELILTDDGSTDDLLEIALGFARSNARAKVISLWREPWTGGELPSWVRDGFEGVRGLGDG